MILNIIAIGVNDPKTYTNILIINVTIGTPIYKAPTNSPINIAKNRMKPSNILSEAPNAPKKLTSLENFGPLVATNITAAKLAIIKNRKPIIISMNPIIDITPDSDEMKFIKLNVPDKIEFITELPAIKPPPIMKAKPIIP